MVETVGGSDVVLVKAKDAFDKGDYRWVAQLVNYVVFAEPSNRAAKLLQADTLEQLGYQSESGIWRGIYLTGAQELRHGVNQKLKLLTPDNDTFKTITPDVVFKDMMVHLSGSKAAPGKNLVLNFDFGEEHGIWQVRITNGVMYFEQEPREEEIKLVTVTLRTTLYDLSMILTKKVNMWTIIRQQTVKIEGNPMTLLNYVLLLDGFNKWFNIVTP
jgi:alkyl sulfatase BDS1-like metallo-beta-lactamase superfamily hydrolase